MPLLAVDPGVHLGYALIPAGEVGVLVLPKDVEGAVRGMMEELRPLLLSSTDLVVEGWQVRGRRPGRDSLVPLALIGALVALGGKTVPPTWKREFAPKVPQDFRGVPGLRFPTGLDPTDRGIWLRLYLDGWLPLLDRVRALPRKHRPHALDALGLARYASLLQGKHVEGGRADARAV
ncbi:hypothetical protein [Thermus scotoductus]|uniref:Uncharacterized protein n=1 Tax=Thermus scotoductus TaxID=37636 RepID=A0A430RTS6_THESC|nr:hypothetical protein [Thermus scotoductus]RTG95797.1 hypothetical protein CSW51_06070 [Thermus scotoductus]RTH23006.1 hypothetical protein CSW38_11630 [Thermus scotoductus]RTI01520.1 hypothetical protein CSW29_04065 [Thermus scotoductus]